MKQLIAKENPWLILFAVSVGLLMAVFGIAIVNIILPVIAEMLDASLAGVQWILISYLLVMIGLVPTFGRISDVIGRKRLFVGGIFVIAGASVLAAMSGSVAWLIAARAIQGIGGAMITSNALAIIADTFPAGKRGAAMGVQAILISGGVAIAPTFGGFLATNFGWEWVFLFNVPMALIAALIAWLVLPPLKSHRTREPIDWVGAAALFGALTPLLLGLTQGTSQGWTSPLVLSLIGGGGTMLVLFVAWEMRTRFPVVDLSLFGVRQFTAGLTAGTFATMAMASALLLFPFYWQGVRGFSAQTAGVLLLPLAGTFMLAAPVAGLLSDRWGARIIGSVGLGIVAVGMFLLSGVGVDTPIWSVLLRLVVLGMGMGMFMAPNNNAVMSAVPPQRRGIASGLLGTTRYLGQTIGITFAGTLFAVFATSGGFRLGQEGLPGPDTINRLASDPEAYAAVQMAFVNGMSGVFLVCIPLALIGVTLSWMRGKPVADDGRVTSEEAATEPAQRGP